MVLMNLKSGKRTNMGIVLLVNFPDETVEYHISESHLYDCILQMFNRENISVKPDFKNQVAISLDVWLKEESKDRSLTLKTLADLKTSQTEQFEFGGNRIEVEFFKGVLILIDDLGWYNANVILV